MRMTLPSLAAASTLLLLAACGGGGGGSSTPAPPATATKLVYTNPTSGAYQLVSDPASTNGTLVLDLVSTTGAPISGVSFSFSVDSAMAIWSAGGAIQIGAFDFGTTSPLAIVYKTSGTELQCAEAQKKGTAAITPTSTTVLAKITLTLKPNAALGAVTFTDTGKGAYLDASGVHPTAISVGQLQAK